MPPVVAHIVRLYNRRTWGGGGLGLGEKRDLLLGRKAEEEVRHAEGKNRFLRVGCDDRTDRGVKRCEHHDEVNGKGLGLEDAFRFVHATFRMSITRRSSPPRTTHPRRLRDWKSLFTVIRRFAFVVEGLSARPCNRRSSATDRDSPFAGIPAG